MQTMQGYYDSQLTVHFIAKNQAARGTKATKGGKGSLFQQLGIPSLNF